MDEAFDLLFQYGHRHWTVQEYDVVELARVELRAEPVGRARAELANLELAHLVGERLAWPGNIAVRLGRDFVDGKCRPRREIVDRLLPSRLEGLESHDRGLWKGKGNLAVNVTV